MYKKRCKNYYTLNEVIKEFSPDLVGDPLLFSESYLVLMMQRYLPFGYQASENMGLEHSPNSPILKSIFLNIHARYQSEICFGINEEDDTVENRENQLKEFLLNVLNKTIDEEDYYYTMLEMLNNNKANLMDKIQSLTNNSSTTSHDTQDTTTLDTEAINSVNMNNSGESVNRVNDTPNYHNTNPESYEGFGYTSQLSKQTGNNLQTGTNSLKNTGTTTLAKTGTDSVVGESTTEHDIKYLYEKIFDIQKNYKDLLGDWVRSYRRCFIESYNIK